MNLPKDCQRTQPLLAAFADGELSSDETDAVRAHVAGCAVCESIAQDFASTARLVSTLPAPPALSAGFAATLARRIADESLAPKPLSPMQKLVAWWDALSTGSRLAPTLATVAATLLAVAIPTGLVLTGRNADTGTNAKPLVAATVAPVTGASLVADDPMLSELWNEHRTFAAAQPLGDPAQAVGGEN